MRPTGKLKIAVMAIVILLSCGTAEAQCWRWHSRPFRVVTVVAQPDVIVHVGNRFTQKERFKMPMAYLKNNDYLQVKKYGKMTELPKAAARMELNPSAAGRARPIEHEISGTKEGSIWSKEK